MSQQFVRELIDIAQELEKPGRDPRSDMPKPILRSDVLSMEDLRSGMILSGTVRNVIDFGAFVDIGVHQDGLVHISQMSDTKFVRHPLDVVSVGDIVKVKVLSVDPDRKRIALTMKLGEDAPASGKEGRDAKSAGRAGSGNGRSAGRAGGGNGRSTGRAGGREGRSAGLDLSALMNKWN